MDSIIDFLVKNNSAVITILVIILIFIGLGIFLVAKHWKIFKSLFTLTENIPLILSNQEQIKNQHVLMSDQVPVMKFVSQIKSLLKVNATLKGFAGGQFISSISAKRYSVPSLSKYLIVCTPFSNVAKPQTVIPVRVQKVPINLLQHLATSFSFNKNNISKYLNWFLLHL